MSVLSVTSKHLALLCSYIVQLIRWFLLQLWCRLHTGGLGDEPFRPAALFINSAIISRCVHRALHQPLFPPQPRVVKIRTMGF